MNFQANILIEVKDLNLINFAYEAATGEEKFGGNLGTADYILSISANYKNGKLYKNR
jgi:hypothetical protein